MKIYQKKEEVLSIASTRVVRLENLSLDLSKDRDVVMAVMKEWGDQYRKIDKELKKDREIALVAVRSFGQSLQDLLPEFKNDKEIVKAAIDNNGNNLQYASKKLKNDEDIVLYALKDNSHAYVYCSERLKRKDKIIKATIGVQGLLLERMSEKIRSNEDYFNLALSTNKAAFRYGLGDFKFKEEYIKIALSQTGNLPYMPQSIRDNEEIVLKEISSNGSMLKYASDRLRSDSTFLIEALKKGMPVRNLEDANPVVFNDRNLMIEAFKSDREDLKNILPIIPKDLLEIFHGLNPKDYLKFLEKMDFCESLEGLLKTDNENIKRKNKV